MEDKLFQELVASIREAGEIRRGKKAREAGKMRLEGKEYVVADGDVMHFRFNV